MRSVQDRFWSDGWVRKLNPLDRYLFLYLLTNEHTNWCGVYELDLSMMAFESGVDERELERSMLPRLAPKIIYVEGWVWVPNWSKHHMSESGSMSPTQQKGFDAAWKQIPEKIRGLMKEIESGSIPYTYPMVGVSPSASSIASAFTISRASPSEVIEFKEEVSEKKSTPKKYPHSKEVFGLWGKYPRNWELNTTQLRAAENLFEEQGLEEIRGALEYWNKHKDEDFCPQVPTPYDLDSKWLKLSAFYDKKHA